MSARSSAAVRFFRLATLAFPKRMRGAFGREMTDTFAVTYADRRRSSPRAAWRFVWRAWVDALLTGARERWRPGGVQRPSPNGRLAQLARRAVDFVWRELGTDIRFAFRTLLRDPVFTVTVVVVVALGVGVNGAVFSVVRAALLKPPPYPDPERLVVVDLTVQFEGRPGGPRSIGWSWPAFEILASSPALAVESIAAHSTRNMTLTGRGAPTRLGAEVVSSRYFDVLRILPVAGRTFSASQDDAGAREVVLSYGLWSDVFGADPAAIGETITLNGEPMSVIGVTPAGFRGLSLTARLWVPLPAMQFLVSDPLVTSPTIHWLRGIARLGDRATVSSLQTQVAVAAERVAEVLPFDDPGATLGGQVGSLASVRRNPRAESAILVVAAAAGAVLLLACINVAGLLLARGNSRRHDIAVRLALGAARSRIARWLVAETFLLATAAGILGLAAAAAAMRGIVTLWPERFSRGGWNVGFVDPSGFVLDASVVAWTLGLGLAAGMLFGVGPAIRLSRIDAGVAMRAGSRITPTGTRSAPSGRHLLVVAEIALGLVLLVSAGLMASTLGRLIAVNQGFDASRLLTFEYHLPAGSVHAEQPEDFQRALLERIRRLPEVESATAGCVPLSVHCWIVDVTRAGETTWDRESAPGVGAQSVDHDYFTTLRIPVLRGRVFNLDDTAGTPRVAILSEAAARRLFGDSSPIGQPLTSGYRPGAAETALVVGVVGDVLYDSPDNGVMDEVYYSQLQDDGHPLSIMVRTHNEPMAVVPALRSALAAIDPDLPIYGVTPVAELGARSIGDRTVVTQLLSAFSAVAMLLAAVGIWGVIAHDVIRRRPELGVRMALGARSGQLISMVVRSGMVSALIGIAIGALVSLGLTRMLGGLLYEVSFTDPWTYAASAALMLGVTLLASWLPTRRIAQIDPVETIRGE